MAGGSVQHGNQPAPDFGDARSSRRYRMDDYRILVIATVVVVAIAAALAGLRGSDVTMAAVDTGIGKP